jgi:hypothetical protein
MKAAYPEMEDTDIRGILGFTQQPPTTQVSDTVKMRDPKGTIRMIPKNQVDAAKKAGGEVVE